MSDVLTGTEGGAETDLLLVRETAALLAQVGHVLPGPVPTVAEVAAWDALTRSRAAAWALSVHLAATYPAGAGAVPVPAVLLPKDRGCR